MHFTFMGYFCSWNCVAAYASCKGTKYVRAHDFIGILAYLTGPRSNALCQDADLHQEGLCECMDTYAGMRRPEPREVLKTFGGSKTIEEFRVGFHMIQDYDWVAKHFLQNPRVDDVVRTIVKGRNKKRDWGFKHVYFPSPAEHEYTHVLVLPHSHRSLSQPLQTGNEETSCTRLDDPLTEGVTAPRRPRPSRSRSNIAPPHQEARSTPTITQQILSVNEEQAYFTQNLRQYGNLMDSMGISVVNRANN